MSYPPQPPNYGHQYPPVVSGPPTQQYSAPPGGGYYPPPPPMPPVKKRNPYTVAGIVIAVVAGFCGLMTVVGMVAGDEKPAAAPKQVAAKPATPPTEPAAKVADEPEPDEPSTFDLPVGKPLVYTDGSGTQMVTVKSAKFRKSCGGPSGPENAGFLVIEVQVVQQEGTGSVNPLFFEHISADGATTGSLSAMFSGCEKRDLGATNSLRKGQKRAGQVAFDVPSAEGSVELQPGLLADTEGSWKIN